MAGLINNLVSYRKFNDFFVFGIFHLSNKDELIAPELPGCPDSVWIRIETLNFKSRWLFKLYLFKICATIKAVSSKYL